MLNHVSRTINSTHTHKSNLRRIIINPFQIWSIKTSPTNWTEEKGQPTTILTTLKTKAPMEEERRRLERETRRLNLKTDESYLSRDICVWVKQNECVILEWVGIKRWPNLDRRFFQLLTQKGKNALLTLPFPPDLFLFKFESLYSSYSIFNPPY